MAYWMDTTRYQPSGDDSQYWGSFDGETFSGDLLLPVMYMEAIELYLMAQLFDDFDLRYDREISRLKGSRIASVPSLEYRLGYDDPLIVEGDSNNTATDADGSLSGGSVQSDKPDKTLIFSVIDSSAASTLIYKFGWTTTPTVVQSGGTVTITSADGEFTNKMLVKIGQDENYEQTDNSTLIIDLPASFGETVIRLEVWR